MPVRVTTSLSQELVEALDAVARDRGESRSSMTEILLREAPQIRASLRRLRGDDADPPLDAAAVESVGDKTRRVYG